MQDYSLYRKILTAPTNWNEYPLDLPEEISSWLLHSGSLTTKLQQHCRQLKVNIIQQGWQQNHWLREVLITGDQQNWIFAQTLIPKTTIEQVAENVLTLGDNPIGLWLFPQQPERLTLKWRQDPQTQLYVRQSQLSLKGYPLQISELFLPEFRWDKNLADRI